MDWFVNLSQGNTSVVDGVWGEFITRSQNCEGFWQGIHLAMVY